MLNSVKRRVSLLERSIDLPVTADRFLARVQEHSRLTGESEEEAFAFLADSLSAASLERLGDELLRSVFGADTEALIECKAKLRQM